MFVSLHNHPRFFSLLPHMMIVKSPIKSVLSAIRRPYLCAVHGIACLISFHAGFVFAAPQDGGLRLELTTAYNFIVDSNVESPSTYAPRAAYISARIWNDSNVPITNVRAYIGDRIENTPGIYPSRVHTENPGITGPLPGGAFAFTHEGGSLGALDASRQIPAIPPGGYVPVYWLVSYPNLDINGKSVTGGSKPNDDLYLFYDIWATGDEGVTPRAVDARRRVYMRSCISAMANKIFPNTANKVPQQYQDILEKYDPEWNNISADGSPGTSVVTEGIWYDLGNVNKGFDNDGNLVPDQNAWLQPVGDPTLFDPSAFRLVRSYALIVVKLKSGGEAVYDVADQLYFTNLPDNTGVIGLVRYDYLPLKANATSAITPYQMAASGNDNEKFNGDYGTSFGLSSPPSALTLEKDVDKTSANPGETLAYTIQFDNPGSQALGDPGSGMPLVIQDGIPAGTIYVAGTAASGNTLPTGVDAYEIRYSTDNGATWTTTEPSPASDVTNIEWWLSDVLQPSASGSVTFSVTVTNPFTVSPPNVVNIAGLSFGPGDPFLIDDAVTFINGSNSISGLVFVDDGSGTGGVFGDGIPNGTEAPIPSVRVTLYYDSNGDGLVDSGDFILGIWDSVNPSGTYQFGNLPDGNYIVLVDPLDEDIPDGHVPTAGILRTADLDSARIDSNPVNATDLDFGFAPILTLEKTGPATAREGEVFSYNIAVTNNFVGDGTGGLRETSDRWATSAVGDKRWLNQANAADNSGGSTPGPNGTFSTVDFGGQPTDQLTLSGFNSAGTGALLALEMRVAYRRSGNFRANDRVTFNLLYDGNVIHTSGPLDPSTFTNNVTEFYTFDATALRTWSFSDLSLLSIRVDATKGGGASQGGTIGIDQGAIRVTTQGMFLGNSLEDETLQPVPLIDRYDPSVLEFVSASPLPTLVNADDGEIFWSNVGPIFAGGTVEVTVSFRALEPPGNTSTNTINEAFSTGATLINGTPVNDADDSATTTILPVGTIGGRLWRDIDPQNGIQDASETGIAGVTVTISGPNGYTGTTITDSNGNYLFTGLPFSGNYTVTVDNSTLPGGTGTVVYNEYGANNSNIGTVAIVFDSTTGADTVLDADFGYSGLQSMISGNVWNDVNRSGTTTPDIGEPGLAGITVRLFDSNNNLVATTTTNASGSYEFLGNFNGTYSVRIDTATGPLGPSWVQTFDSDGLGTAHRAGVTVPTGGSAMADFSYAQGGAFTIGDTIFYDWDGDGVQQSSEVGIPNIIVRLYQDIDGNSVFNPLSDPIVATAETDANGNYLFSSLAPGTYFVIVDVLDSDFPGGLVITADPFEARDGFSRVTITTANNLDQDFGFQPTGSGALSGVVWRDRNSDGSQAGAAETGISGVSVFLQVDLNGDGNFQTIASTVSASDGTYSFAGLPDAIYQVLVDPEDGSIPVDGFGNAWYPTTQTTQAITVSGGTASDTGDFGFNAPSALGGTIFFDINANGDFELNEPGIEDAIVQLFEGSTLIAVTTADADGNYLFTGLMPGTYTVVVDSSLAPLAGATLSSDPDNDGEPCAVDPIPVPCDAQSTRTLAPAQTLTGLNFGYLLPGGTISGILWNDFDGDDAIGDEESRFQFILVELLDGANQVIATTFTDENGFYSFGGLADGTYTVRVNGDDELPAGFAQTYDPDGTLDEQTTVTVSDASRATADFGYRNLGTNSLIGTVGLETADPATGLLNGTNPSGVGAGEAPFANVTVFIYTWNDANTNGTIESDEIVLLGSTLTDANGDYAFTDLPDAGFYIVSIAAPMNNLELTTTAATVGHPATEVVVSSNSQGHTTGAYQVVAADEEITNMDFAFISVVDYDFGDLPDSYSTLLPNGARHIVPNPDSPTLYLGQSVTTEANGQPSVNADADGGDDGVFVTGIWNAGGSISVDVVGTGWLVGYIDFENNGSFLDAGNLVVSQAVTTGSYDFNIAVPAGAIDMQGTTLLYARFRLLPTQPFIPELVFNGEAANGEVEDYRWAFNTISGVVFVDADSDDIFSGGDIPQAGVVVRLFDDADNELAVSVTNFDGSYSFFGLPSGSYEVRMDTPTNSTAILDVDGGDPTVISVVLTDESIGQRDFLLSGATSTVVAALSGTVFVDSDRDDDFSAGDTTREGVTIRLYRDINGNGEPDAFELVGEAQTDASGGYLFADLPAGSYLVVMVSSAGVEAFLDVDGDTNGNDLIAVSLSDANIIERDFLARFNASIAGTIEIDTMRDGMGDAPHVGVTVELLDENDNVIATTTTDLAGGYVFGFLPPGEYKVRQTLPANFLAVSDVDGGDLTVIGDVSLINLALDEQLAGQDFVNRLDAATVAGVVWFDVDSDGLRDAGEPLAGGVTVRLLDSNLAVVATTTTASDGSYLFLNLEPGDYTVEFVLPSNAAFTLKDADSEGLGGQLNSDANTTTGRTESFSLAFGQDVTGVDAGLLRADLGVVKSVDQPAANIGDVVTYTIVATNYGPTATTSVVLTEFFPIGMEILSNETTKGSFSGNLWDLDVLAVGESATLTIQAEVLSDVVGQGLTNVVSITASDVPDPNTFNNSSSATVQISGLQITKTSDQTGFVPLGGTIEYTVVVENVGNIAQHGLTLSDLMPAGVTYVPDSVQSSFQDPSPLPTGSQTFSTAGFRSFVVPEGVTSLQVEAWGGGASGAASDINNGGGGGGGGAYARHNAMAVSPGQSISLFVAEGGGPPGAGNPGQDGAGSWFMNPDTVFAEGGFGGIVPTGGAGGRAVESIGSVVYSGGNGGSGATSGGTRAGGGGGGSAYTNADGGAGGNASGSTPGIGGLGTGNGGAGGLALTTQGQAGFVPGGGGGGCSGAGDGVGAPGRIVVSYNIATIAGNTGAPAALATGWTLAPGATLTVTFSATVAAPVSSEVTNVATVTSSLVQSPMTAEVTDLLAVGSISGTIRIDTTGDRSGNDPQASVTVTLLDGDDNVVATTTTDSSGGYLFELVPPGSYRVVQTVPAGFIAVNDVDGGDSTINGDVESIVITAGVDVAGQDFVNQQAVTIAGIVRADTTGDGLGNLALGGVLLTLLDDADNVVATTTTASNGTYSFTNLLAGTYQVAQTQPVGYGSLSDKDGGDPNLIGDVQMIELLPGEQSVDNDFLEYLQKCPDTWAAWQEKWDEEINGQTGPLDNPDGDRYNNLIEYAFCLPPHLGVRKPFCLFASESAAGGVDGLYSRTAIGGAKDVTYVLEWTAALESPTTWTGSVVLSENNTTVTNNGDGSETVRISDLETLTGLSGGSGFVRIRVDLDDGTTEATAYTEVLGWQETEFGLCCSTYCNPFLECAVFTGTVDEVDGQNLVFANSAEDFDLSAILEPGIAYYIEVETGTLEGHRFDIASGGIGEDRRGLLTIANDDNLFAFEGPFNTVAGSAPAGLEGARIAVHRHKTLRSMFPPSAFGGADEQASADRVQFNIGGQWFNFWLYQPEQGARYWATSANMNLDDLGGAVIPPGRGMFLDNRGGQLRRVKAFGEVRGHAFANPLPTGVSLIAGGYPVDQSPRGPNSREMHLAIEPGVGFFGSRNFATADSIFRWRADGDSSASGYDSYFLATVSSGNFWYYQPQVPRVDRSGDLIFESHRSVLQRVRDGYATYRIPAPWSPLTPPDEEP